MPNFIYAAMNYGRVEASRTSAEQHGRLEYMMCNENIFIQRPIHRFVFMILRYDCLRYLVAAFICRK